MKESEPIDSDLLARYLAGEADASQRTRVEEWAAASTENARELAAMQRLWSYGAESFGLGEIDVDAAWSRLETRITESEGAHERPIAGGGQWRIWLAAAAVLSGLLVAAWLFMQPAAERFTARESALPVTLADGSTAVLKADSRLETRMGVERSVRLEGSAYFDVKRDPEHPFVIDARDLEVTVLGTSFEVSAYDTARFATVRVRSGRVQVVAGGDTLVLVAGEHARYDQERHILEREKSSAAEEWGLRVLQFEGATMPQVAAQLKRLYQVHVQWNDASIANCRLTAEFDDEPIERIITVIAETFGWKVEATPSGFTFDGKGC